METVYEREDKSRMMTFSIEEAFLTVLGACLLSWYFYSQDLNY